MTLTILCVGKTDSKELATLISNYSQRLKHYITFELLILPDIKSTKNLSVEEQKNKEGQLILNVLRPSDVVVLLDERGIQFTSKEFSEQLQKRMNSGIKKLVFVIGGPYGFSTAQYERSNAQISLSKMTFSHQMVRLFALEQIYRAFTILRNEPYHHG